MPTTKSFFSSISLVLLLQAVVTTGSILPSKRSTAQAASSFSSDVVGGIINFSQDASGVTTITWDISGNDPNALRGMHIHTLGNSTDCTQLGGHYNPFSQNHGGPDDAVRHVGDLGNIQTDSTGRAQGSLTSTLIQLTGDYSIVGRSVIIHGGTDDLGKGGDANSLVTGNSGARLACGTISSTGEDDVP